ncbi:MAG TPA: hypothetical protein VEX65_12010 [Flavisolibacter sp.]|jgi:hypothetical protein|nr:hypothetical protein [Flavisolibacter sp.]
MLAYRLPFFLDYLSHHYYNLYSRYMGRLIELFPSSQQDDNNLVIVHDAADAPAEDEQVLQLWNAFKSA